MGNERLLALLDDIEEARTVLMGALERIGENLGERRLVLEPGFRLSERDPVPGVVLHEEFIAALERMHHAVASARAESVRVMVDEEGLTLSDVAKLMNRPRQLVSRLYRSAEGASAPGRPRHWPAREPSA
jgi:NADH:ubiquinone oxidoreductase subunit D